VSGSGSITTSTPSRFVQTWNGSGTTVFDTIIANVSTANTTSSADSTLIHLQHTDTTTTPTTSTRFKVDRIGNAIANSFSATTGTLTASRPGMYISQTWNNASANFSALTVDVTDTNSGAGSNLLDLRQNGATRFAVSKVGVVTFGGAVTFGPTSDLMITMAAATSGTVTHDFQNHAVFLHPSPAGNITVNITNLPTTNDRIMVVSVMLSQGATAYIINGLQIQGVNQTIRWLNNVIPVGSPNSLDVYGFTIVRTNAGVWIVTGSQASYG